MMQNAKFEFEKIQAENKLLLEQRRIDSKDQLMAFQKKQDEECLELECLKLTREDRLVDFRRFKEVAQLELEKKKEECKDKLAMLDMWKGKNTEFDYKFNLISQYKSMKEDMKITGNQIIASCPDMQPII